MKNLKYFLMALLFAPVLMSCEDEPLEMGQPTIVFTNDMTESRVVEGVLVPAITGSVTTAVEEAIIESITVTAYEGTDPVVIATLADMNGLTKVSDSEYSFSYTEASEGLANIINTLTKVVVAATVVDGEGSSNSVTVTFESGAPTYLSGAKTLQWKKTGSNNPDLSEFGLTWTTNSGTNAIVKKDANTKLVQLNANQWNLITTVEALKAAVDNAPAADVIDQYTGVSVTAANKNYNDVLAVNVEGAGNYKIIHITNSTVVINADLSSTVTINGQYKDDTQDVVD